jgi:phosphoglycolate phosphatase-like HAD superfamily hydrolase
MHQLIEQLLCEFDMPDIDLSSVYFAGRTDHDIFYSILKMGTKVVSETLFHSFKNAYIRTLQKELLPAYVHLLSHVNDVISYCTDQKFHFGLLTGNFRESAYIKLQRAGIDRHFTFGVFGSDHSSRNELPAIARLTAEKHFKRSFVPRDLVIIGDTPRDIDCARHYGAVSVAVATGTYSYDDLALHKPDILLTDLSNPSDWLQTI